MNRLLHLLVLAVLPFVQIQAQTGAGNKWEKEIIAFEEADKKEASPADAVLFVGSSSIKYWPNLASDFPEVPVIQRGFGGSTIVDSVYYADRIVVPYRPRVVVFYSGGNDINRGLEPTQVLEAYRAFDEKILKELPETHVIYISLNPTIKRAEQDGKVRESNRLLQEYLKDRKDRTFIDSYSLMVGQDGKARPGYMYKDGLHLGEEGYQAWKKIIKPVVLQIYEETKKS